MKEKLQALGIAALVVMVGVALGLSLPTSIQAAPPTSAVACTSSVAVSGASAATAELVPLVAGKRIYVCGFVLNGAGATTATLKYGTGSTCGSGTTSLTGAFKFVDGSTVALGTGVGYVLKTPVANALCWTNSGTVQVSGVVSYLQY